MNLHLAPALGLLKGKTNALAIRSASIELRSPRPLLVTQALIDPAFPLSPLLSRAFAPVPAGRCRAVRSAASSVRELRGVLRGGIQGKGDDQMCIVLMIKSMPSLIVAAQPPCTDSYILPRASFSNFKIRLHEGVLPSLVLIPPTIRGSVRSQALMSVRLKRLLLQLTRLEGLSRSGRGSRQWTCLATRRSFACDTGG